MHVGGDGVSELHSIEHNVAHARVLGSNELHNRFKLRSDHRRLPACVCMVCENGRPNKVMVVCSLSLWWFAYEYLKWSWGSRRDPTSLGLGHHGTRGTILLARQAPLARFRRSSAGRGASSLLVLPANRLVIWMWSLCI